MFKVKFFVSYEAVISPDSIYKSYDVIVKPSLVAEEDMLGAYIGTVAEDNNVSTDKIVITSFTKIN